jgi:hypothetical protein
MNMPDLLRGGIAINEILVDPNGAINFDTDGNGTAEATDEFIELVNIATGAIDISGLQIWDAGNGKVFTFPPGTVLQPGAHALVITGVQSGGSLPTGGGPDDLAFDIGRGSAYINNGGDNVVIYDPANDAFIQATFNGDSLDNPTAGGGGYSGFSPTATRSGSGENFGNDTDGQSLQRLYDTADTFTSATPTPAAGNVCFCKGTALASPNGWVQVEDVRPGDWLMTSDHGPARVLWVGARIWSPHTLRKRPKLAPIRIRRGALGAGLPLRDLYLSAQHRVLVEGPIARRMFEKAEVMVAAMHLCALRNVDVVVPAKPVVYYHVMFAGHEVVNAEGIRAESLFLGAEALKAIPKASVQEITTLLGLVPGDLPGRAPAAARPFATGQRAASLLFRHAKNRMPLQGSARRPGPQGASCTPM